MPDVEGLAYSPAGMIDVPVGDLDVFVGQARTHFDPAELQALADDLRIRGQLQPGVAWADPGRNRLVLVCGERRLRAIKLAGLPTMAVKVIRGSLSQGQLLELNLSENLQRSSLNAMERAKGFRRLMQLEDVTASEIASRLNVSNATVSNALALLELPESLQERIAAGRLPASVGVHLARVGDAEIRRSLADQFEGGTLNREGVASEVKQLLKANAKGKGKAKPTRLAVRVDGVAVSLAAKSLGWDSLIAAIDRIRLAAERLAKDNKPVAALAAALKAS